MDYSPLFWPIELKDDGLYILDETQLPARRVFIKAVTAQEACEAIKGMKTRAVGQVILVMYMLLAEIRAHKAEKDLASRIAAVVGMINAARPTLPFRMLTGMVQKWLSEPETVEHKITGFLEQLRRTRIEQAEAAAGLLEDGDTVLTHCNISGLMPLIGQICRTQKKKIGFYVTETRPYLQGARLTAWELHEAGLPVTVIADNMAAEVMHEKKVSRVIVGADHLAQNGDIANKIGTLQLAIVASHFGVPFYVICPPPSQAKTGEEIAIEIRPEKELLEFNGMRIAPEGVAGYYPAFDVTPARLITKHIYLSLSKP